MTNDEVNIRDLIIKLEVLKNNVIERERSFPDTYFQQFPPSNRESARNLIHYLSMRTYDLRPIQEELSTLGLSSLSHSERYTLVNINNILHILYKISGEKLIYTNPPTGFSFNFPAGRKRLYENTEAIFGASRRPGSCIMVTMPSEAANDYELVEKLMTAGMDVARINCSHDEEGVWKKMIENIHTAAAARKISCLIYMDLPGPKLRTGPVNPKLIKKKKKGKKTKKPAIRLHIGDALHIFRTGIVGDEAKLSKAGEVNKPACISITWPNSWGSVRTGDSIYFDDGKIGGKVEKVGPEKIEVVITRACSGKGSPLRSDKGVNFPDTNLLRPSLTAFDMKILPFICANADMVGFSFVRKPADLHELREQFQRLDREDLPVILKIETREAFKNLPELLLEGMNKPHFGVMIARGDLAIEVGFTRIAEVQEQILWLCDAAHVPIIWATQVLENLLKEGLASRAEITDAAMSVRAECVMLNKGPFIREALETLTSIDERMVNHMFKKHGALRPLNVAGNFFKKKKTLL